MSTLYEIGRQHLKSILNECTEPQILMFKRMYSHKNLEADTDTVVDNMPDDKIDWAIQQVERTINK